MCGLWFHMHQVSAVFPWFAIEGFACRVLGVSRICVAHAPGDMRMSCLSGNGCRRRMSDEARGCEAWVCFLSVITWMRGRACRLSPAQCDVIVVGVGPGGRENPLGDKCGVWVLDPGPEEIL